MNDILNKYIENTKETNEEIRSSAQGVFMMMTNGFGATIGMLIAQYIVNHYVYSHPDDLAMQLEGWKHSWFIFAGYALVVTILFAIVFKYKHNPNEIDEIKH